MGLDIRTLIVVLGITHTIQFVVLLQQNLANRTTRGVGWWLLWSAAEVGAFTFMILRAIPSIQSAAIIAQNGLLIVGVMFFYVGIVRFHEKKENRRLLAALYAAFLAGIYYFLYVRDDIGMRAAIISATVAIMAFLTARVLLANKTRSTATSANLLAVVCIAHGCHFAFRLALQLVGSHVDSFFAPTLFNWTALADAIAVGLLWTFGTVLLINQRLNAEMKAAKEEIELTFSTIPDAVVISRLKDGVITNVNEGFEELSGFTRAECIGKTALAVDLWRHPADREAILTALRREGSCRNNEQVFRRKDGTEMLGLMSAAVLNLKDTPHIISVIRDITQHKQAEADKARLEAQLQQARKMESVGRLAGGVAHEFNNKLMGIMNYVELCRDELSAQHPVRSYLDEIAAEAQHSAGIARQLLAFARKQHIAPKVLDLNDALAGMLGLLRQLLGEDIDLDWRPGTHLWPVRIDPAQIDQVLTNLCANARDAIAGVGKVAIETGNVTLDDTYCAEHADAAPGEYVRLTVSDTGCGMDTQMVANLFEPFFTTQELAKGAGLGLATVYGIVRQNQGHVAVQSAVGKGTTFSIYLPRAASEANTGSTAVTTEGLPRGTETILLAEDEKSVRATSGLFLKQFGYTVLTAGTPEEALRLAGAHSGPIHLLITDVIMPGMNGPDLAKRLAEKCPNLKALFISGYTADVLRARGTLDERMPFLSKPFSRDDLARKVREVLDGR
jgi:PAS domain S-box-containing protein